MNATLDACLKTCTQLVNPADFSGLAPCEEKSGFGEESSPRLANPNWPYSWTFV
jgi:hypothetical protein